MRGYSLLNSKFNDFLFAPIGDERNEMPLSVLSALARLGIDPWQEAARLSELPKEQATQSLTSMIEGLPSGRWARSDSRAIAARLAQFLPSRSNLKASLVTAPNGINRMIRSLAVMWLIYAVVWGATLMMAGNREPPLSMKQTGTHLTNAIALPEMPLRSAD